MCPKSKSASIKNFSLGGASRRSPAYYIEVLCSPIVEACPFDHKEKVMSLLLSFYCWGSVGVILISTLFFALFGIDSWGILACIFLRRRSFMRGALLFPFMEISMNP